MLNARISAKTLKRIVNVLRNTNEEAVLSIDHSGIATSIVDRGNAHMTMIKLSYEEFETYECDEHRIGIDLDNLWNKLRAAKVNDMVYLSEETKDDKPIRLLLKIGNGTFGVSLLDTDKLCRPKQEPNGSQSVAVEISGVAFKQMIKFSEVVSDLVMFSAENETFCTIAGEEDTYKFELDNSAVGEGKSRYNLDYLHAITNGIDDKDIITLRFGGDVPLEVSFAIGECEITQYLAPRIIKE